MGQYYMPTLIDQEGNIKSLNAHNFDNGLKLTEHSWIGNNLVNAVLCLIENNPMRIAWIGDYSKDPYEDAYAKALPQQEFMHYYDAVWGEDDRLIIPASSFSPKKLDGICTLKTIHKFIVNHTKKQFIHLGEYITRSAYTEKGGWENDRYNVFATSTWCVHPLPLLTACGNDRGGGDYRSDYPGFDDVGTWAFDLLEFTTKAPSGYAATSFRFIEKVREEVSPPADIPSLPESLPLLAPSSF